MGQHRAKIRSLRSLQKGSHIRRILSFYGTAPGISGKELKSIGSNGLCLSQHVDIALACT